MKKIGWNIILLELFIVFIGVYLAFLLSNFRDNQHTQQEADRILTSLKVELEAIRYQFPGRADYQRDLNTEWDSIWNAVSYNDFYNWRYIQPQYDFTTLEYALNTRENAIIDFTLYDKLTDIYQTIQQLSEVETRITDIGFQYRNIPDGLDQESQEYRIRRADNRLLFYKFRMLGESRANNLNWIAEKAVEALAVVDNKLRPKKREAIELDILASRLPNIDPEKEYPVSFIYKEVTSFFPALDTIKIKQTLEEYYN